MNVKTRSVWISGIILSFILIAAATLLLLRKDVETGGNKDKSVATISSALEVANFYNPIDSDGADP